MHPELPESYTVVVTADH